MDLKTAKAAIEGILAAIDDDELPPFGRVEFDENGLPVVWHDGMGRCLGTAKSRDADGKMRRNPQVYRSDAARSAIGLEMAYRADRLLLDNGDKAAGLDFTRLAVKR